MPHSATPDGLTTIKIITVVLLIGKIGDFSCRHRPSFLDSDVERDIKNLAHGRVSGQETG
jgi:hypothetical protein